MKKKVLFWFFIAVVAYNSLLQPCHAIEYPTVSQSWVGQTQEELLSVWGDPVKTSFNPRTNEVIWDYEKHPTFLRVPGEIHDRLFMIDPKTKLITRVFLSDETSSASNATGLVSAIAGLNTSKIVHPTLVSPTWLKEAKQQWILIEDFTVKETNSGKQVIKIRKDSNAYESGLRKGDYILKRVDTSSPLDVITLTIQRKVSLLSGDWEQLVLTFPPTFHSKAYETMYPEERKMLNIEN